MEIFRTARFYQTASEEEIDQFESALDQGDNLRALEIVKSHTAKSYPLSFDLAANKEPNYLDESPEVGDMVFVTSSNHYARLISISDDHEIALVKEEWGAYTVPYASLRRVR